MAERRLKAMAEEGDNEMDVEIEGVGESEDLDLRLSIEQWGWKGASSSLGSRSSWLSPFELIVGSSSYSENLDLRGRLKQNPGEFTEEMEAMELDGSNFHAAERISSDDMDRDAQHKRAKLLFDAESSKLSQNDGGENNSLNSVHSENIMNLPLPGDLLHLVFSFLSQRDLCKAGASCKQWQDLSMRENLWNCLNLEDDKLTLKNFEALCHRYPNAIKVNLVGALHAETLVFEAMTSLRCLETLHLGKGQLGDEFFQALTYCPALNSLSIYDTSFGDDFQEISLHHDRLHELKIVKCHVFRVAIRCPQLQTLKVSNCSLLQRVSIVSDVRLHNLQEVDLSDCKYLTNFVCENFSDGRNCPMLKVLVLDNCESLAAVKLNSYSLVSISLVGCRAMNELDLSCPNLLKINLNGCDHLEEASLCPVGLKYLNLGICPKLTALQIRAPKMSVLELKACGMLSQASICCPTLTSLDASFCWKFTDDSLSRTADSCRQIESLILSYCLAITFDGLSSVRWLQYLTHLDLSYTYLTNLQPVFDSCWELLTLNLCACIGLNDSSLFALYNGGVLPALRELDLSYTSIGQAAIVDLLAYRRNLVDVNLKGCKNLHKLAWDSSSEFQSTGMKIGPTLSNLLTLGNGDISCGKSDHLLKFLNCTGCPKLQKVVIPSTACCFRLTKLNLNLSANLKEVDLSCPNLSSLNLSNCSSLEILKLDCPRLTNLQLSACSMLSEAAVKAAISGCCISDPPNVHSSTRARLLQRITGT